MRVRTKWNKQHQIAFLTGLKINGIDDVGVMFKITSIISGELRKARTLHGCRIGPASKALATFGPSTLVIVRERGRMKPEGSQVRT